MWERVNEIAEGFGQRSFAERLLIGLGVLFLVEHIVWPYL